MACVQLKKLTSQFSLSGGVFFYCLMTTSLSQAQITSDNTLSTDVNTSDSLNFTITGGRQAGGNLFHSFSQFSVPTDGSAIFDNALGVQNIFSRVTGSSISNIDGLIRAHGNASLFLINPNGIIFGPNAQLNIGGSFIATTANQIDFADGTSFSTTDLQAQPLLSVSIPTGLQFRETSKPIVNQSRVVDSSGLFFGLEVQPGKTLALVGGDIFLDGGGLVAPDGRIELGSFAGNSFVSLTSIAEGWALEYENVQSFQDIHLSGAAVNTIRIGESNGDILISGRQISITNNSTVTAINSGANSGGAIVVKASESLEVNGLSDVNSSTISTGAAGEIIIETRRLIVSGNSFIESASQPMFGDGQGGNLTVNASESVEVDGSSFISTRTFGNQNAGDLTVTTQRLILSNGGQITSSTEFAGGNGGTVSVNAYQSIEVSGEGIIGTPEIGEEVDPSGLFASTTRDGTFGNGGSLSINTSRLSVRDGGSISVAADDGSIGQGGSLNINASELVVVSGTNSTVLATSESSKAGDLTINTPLLTLQDGATISASSPLGEGGDIKLQGLNSLRVSDNSNISASTRSGSAGNLTVTATESVQLSGTGRLSVEATEGGTAGNLTVETGQMSVSDGARVTVSSRQGQAGNLIINANSLSLNRGSITAETGESGIEEGANITLQLSDLLRLENESKISATANGDADGGNININTPLLTVFPPTGPEGSDIIANAERGTGGNIIINAQGIFGIAEGLAIPGNQSNDIDASSEFGASGQVEINSTIDPNRGVVQLPETITDPNALVAQNPCKRGSQSQFTRTGRGGLPPNLNEDLSSEATQVGLVEPAPMNVEEQEGREVEEKNSSSSSEITPIVPAQGWIFNDKGEVVLTAYNPTVTGPQRLKENPARCPAP